MEKSYMEKLAKTAQEMGLAGDTQRDVAAEQASDAIARSRLAEVEKALGEVLAGRAEVVMVRTPTIMRSEEREAAFRAAIEAVCKEHKATMRLTDDGKPYGMHSPTLEITMMSEYDDDGNVTKEFTDFNW